MKTELQLLTDVQLLEEIQRQWYWKACWDYDKLKYDNYHSPADDYFSSDVEEYIHSLEEEYKSRGFELPDRWQYVAQFMPEPDETGE